jgi:hypothetical protein
MIESKKLGKEVRMNKFIWLFLFLSEVVFAEIEWPNIIEPNPLFFNGFGDGVANMDEWLVIGETQYSDHVSNGGALHVYQNVNGLWTLYQTLTADDAENNDQLGSAAAIERNHQTGELWIVGTALNDDDSGPDQGAVYAFQMDNQGDFIQRRKFVGTNASRDFGKSVALNFDYIEDVDAHLWVLVIGDDFMRRPDNIGGGTHSTGGMTIYKKNDGMGNFIWDQEPVQTSQFFLDSLDSFDRWGTSVSVDGIYIVAGATGWDVPDGNGGLFTDAGGVFFAFRDHLTQTWSCCSVLTAPTPVGSANLGQAVEVIKQPFNNISVIAGAPLERPENSSDQNGAVYIWQNSGFVQKLVPSIDINNQGERFGSSIAANGDTYFGINELLISAPNSEGNKGRVYLFSKNPEYNGANELYLEKQTIVGSDTNTSPWDVGQFGYRVSSDGRNHVAVSASLQIGSHRRVHTKEYPIFVDGFESPIQQ